MSVVTVLSAGLLGVEAHPVRVEVSLTQGLPGIRTVGLPDATLREGEKRIWLALRSTRLLGERPSAVVNLAPAELRKTGPAYELPIALGLLCLRERFPAARLKGWLVAGELSLHGDIRPVRGVLAMADLARSLGLEGLVVPDGNGREASSIDGVKVHGARDLCQLVQDLAGDGELPLVDGAEAVAAAGESRPGGEPDLADVRGQAQARRALEIAAAGGHNLLLAGPPGSGKTMLARRLPALLPPLDRDEAIETTRIHSAAGLLVPGSGLVKRRPFRAPHHTISSAGLAGGYVPPRPGEVSLAHNGVLFLDEMAEFSRPSLEALREPLEEDRIRVVRGGASVLFPARVMLVGATNPCPCGYQGDAVRTCACAPAAIERYRRSLSGPLLDRIDLHVEVPRVRADELVGAAAGEPTRQVAARVASARERQRRRFGPGGPRANARLEERALGELVPLDGETERALGAAIDRLGLSPRAWVRIVRVARTIADLAGDERVRLGAVLEAIHYRSLDRRPL